MFKTKFIISTVTFVTFLIITSTIKNKTRLIEKNLSNLSQEILLKKKDINETQLDFYYLTSPKEIFTNYINLLMASQVFIEDDSTLMKNLNMIVNYFDAFTTNVINKWQVTIENNMKFTLNQSRILRTLKGLYS